jgi:CheY-like chemotaxis protein
MTDERAAPPAGADAQPGAQPGILVVDDDQMLLALLKLVFQRQGFAVWAAASGAMAVDLYRRHQEHINVVLLDVCMPGQAGPEVLAELKRHDPFVTCCFMSGHTGDYTVEDLEDLGAVACYDKPFRTQEMAKELWQLATQHLRRSA